MKGKGDKVRNVKFAKAVALMMALTFMISPFVTKKVGTFVVATASTDVDDAKARQEELEEELKNTEALLDQINNNITTASEAITLLDARITALNANIKTLEAEIAEKQAEIEEAKEQLAETEEEIQKQYASMKLRIQYLYESRIPELVEILLSAGSISDFLNESEYYNQLTTYDRQMLQKMEETKADIEALEAQLEAELAEIEAKLAEVEAEKATVDSLYSTKTSYLANQISQQSSTESEILEIQADIEEQKKEVARLEELEKQRLAAQTNLTYDGGTLIWPLPGYTRLTDGYILNRKIYVSGYGWLIGNHYGQDIPAPTGTAVLCCYNGQVADIYYNSTSGNVLVIDHGDGLYTIYKHLSGYNCAVGDYVLTGEVIAYVGATGAATGAHLHVEVRLNGVYQDPLDWLTPS